MDEKALTAALQKSQLAGAALDVFEKEPIDMNNPLIGMNNVVIVPHIASASIETRTGMAKMAAENIISGLRGMTPKTLVNKEILAPKT